MELLTLAPCMMFLIIPLFIALVVVLILVGQAQAKKRREDMAALARQLGMRFNPNRDRSFDDRYAFFDALRRGDDRYAYNILTGDFEGRNIVAFDYHYETSSRDSDGDRSTTSHHFSAVIFQAGLPVHGLTIRPEGVFDRFKQFFGFDDIDFESAEFSKRFHVACRDRQLAYDVVQPKTMEVMLSRPQFYLHFERGLVMAMRNSRFQPNDFRAAIHLVDDILDLIPQSTREQLEMRHG
jgi:hypothetical protein